MTQLDAMNAWADYLQEDRFGLTIFCSLTYSNDAIDEYRVFTQEDVRSDLDVFLKEIGYEAPLFGVIEHAAYRTTPHLHLLMQEAVPAHEVK